MADGIGCSHSLSSVHCPPSRESVRHRPSSIVANEPTGDLLSNRTRPPLFPPFPGSFYSWLLATLCFLSAFPLFSPPRSPSPTPIHGLHGPLHAGGGPATAAAPVPLLDVPDAPLPPRPPVSLPRARPFDSSPGSIWPGLARAPRGYLLTRVSVCGRAQGGAGADDQVQGARRGPGPRARGVLRAAVHGRRLAHLRGHHHLALRPWVIISALVCYCFRPSIHVSGDPCWGLRLLRHHTLVSPFDVAFM